MAANKTIRKVKDHYMESETAVKMLPMLLRDIETMDENQKGVDDCYDKITKLILSETDKSSVSGKGMCKNTKIKEYWDLELAVKWKQMQVCERDFRKYSRLNKVNRAGQVAMRQKFYKAQKAFDKLLNKKKRAFAKGLLLEIEKYNFNNPNAFWRCLNQLGPTKTSEIPWEVEIDGTVIADHDQVLEKWRIEYEKLYDVNDCGFDEAFLLDKIDATNLQ